jgi:cytochrome c-type biogenesis protein CcmF
MLSRESAFLFNNLLLVGIAFATLWGTIFPVLSEWVRGVKITVGPPFFNKVNAPLAIALLFLMGVGPLISWRRASAARLRKLFLAPLLTGLVSALAALAAGVFSLSALAVLSLSVFVMHTVVIEFHRGAQARMTMAGEGYGRALMGLVERNQRRYGGYIVHVGVVFIFIGVTMSSVYRVEELHTVAVGEEFSVGDYTMRFSSLDDQSDPHVMRMVANLDLSLKGRALGQLKPEKRFYRRPQQPATEVDMRSTLAEDLYVILGNIAEDGKATFQVYVNPLVAWLWLGGIVVLGGTILALLPRRARHRSGPPPRKAAKGNS